MQAQVGQRQRGIGSRGRILLRRRCRRVLVLRFPVSGGYGLGIDSDDVLAVGAAAHVVGWWQVGEAAGAGVVLLGLALRQGLSSQRSLLLLDHRPPERRRGGEASPEETCLKLRN